MDSVWDCSLVGHMGPGMRQVAYTVVGFGDRSTGRDNFGNVGRPIVTYGEFVA